MPADLPISAPAKLRVVAREDPDRPAIVTRTGTMTYAELDAAVDRTAAWLLTGRDPDDERVVVMRFRGTVPVIVTSLALARAGLVSAMIDPMAPPARVEALLHDLSVDGRWLLVTDLDDDVRRFADATSFEDAQTGELGVLVSARELGVDDVQSIIHTSGSTGTPVGLQLTGRQRIAMDAWARQFDVYKEGARIGILGAGTLGRASEPPRLVIMGGATMIVHDVLADGLDSIPGWLRDERIQAFPLVPTLLLLLLPGLHDELGPDGVLPDLMVVLLWGESSDWESVVALARHLPADAVVLNAYGQTETGIVASLAVTQDMAHAARDRKGSLAAGHPVAGVSVRVVDPDGTDVEAGQVGELWVAGPHLARGHWRRPELTRDALVDDGGRAYWRTSDGAYVDDAGLLHVTGRLDDIVKIRGHRISLIEVERTAREQPGVVAAAAVARDDPDAGVRLHLFVVADESRVHPRWLRAQMARMLPPAALPDTVDLVDALPTLGSGKLDRSALPEPRSGAAAPEASDPDLVWRVTGLFAQVLKRPDLAPDDDFFELGGDSLRAGRLVALLQTELGLYVPASLVLEAPTPRLLATAVTSSRPTIVVPVRTEGTGVPLFVVHGSGGGVWFAHSIARHLDDRPVYAVQPPPLLGPVAFAPTLQEVAERYLVEILRVQPSGPYRLFGYSMGGLIAFEIATLLQDRGERVELLALGDTATPEQLRATWTRAQEDRNRARAAAVTHLDVRDLARRGRRYLASRAHARREQPLWRDFEAGNPPAPELRDAAHERVYGRLVVGHRIRKPFDGDVSLVSAARGPGAHDNGWGPYVDGSLHVTSIDADHTGILGETYLPELCRALAVRPAAFARPE